MWGSKTVIPALGNLKQEDPSKLESNLVYTKKSQASQGIHGEALSRQEPKCNPQKANSTVKTPGLSNRLKLEPISKVYYLNRIRSLSPT